MQCWSAANVFRVLIEKMRVMWIDVVEWQSDVKGGSEELGPTDGQKVESECGFVNKGISTVCQQSRSFHSALHTLLSRTNLHFSTLTRQKRHTHTRARMHTHRGGAGRMRFVFIYFPLKHEKRRNSPQRAQRFDICSPVSVNRLGEDDVCMCVCLHVCTHVFVLIWVLHVHVNLSSCGVSYFWQEIVGGEVCVFVCVCVFTFSCWGLWMFLVLVQAGRQAGRQGAMWST